MTFEPTKEQKAIVEKCAEGVNLKVVAYAGTGKTSTLFLCAEKIPDKRILYICFDAESAKRARSRMPSNVTSKTFHAYTQGKFIESILANKEFGPTVVESVKERLHGSANKKRLNDGEVAKLLEINSGEALDYTTSKYLSYYNSDEEDRDNRVFSPAEQVRVIRKAITKFCNSADDEFCIDHFEKVYPSTRLFEYALKYWKNVDNAFGSVPLTHDMYAKIWCLKNKTIDDEYDVLFIDEAQDTNPLQAQFYRNQPVQKIYVGDSRQAIYSFRGSIDELNKVPDCVELSLTESFRFGSTIALASSNVYKNSGNDPLPIVGKAPYQGYVSEDIYSPDVILVRKTVTMLDMIFSSPVIDERKIWFKSTMKDDLINTMKTLKWFIDNPKGSSFRPDYLTPDLSIYENFFDLLEAVRLGDESPRTKKMLDLVRSTQDFDSLIDQLKSFGGRKPAKGTYIEIMTVHKAKGNEWNHVQLANDFRMPFFQSESDNSDEPTYYPPREELNIYYVAITRAKKSVGLGRAFEWITEKQKESAEQKSHKVVTTVSSRSLSLY